MTVYTKDLTPSSGHPNVLPIIEANIYDDIVIIASEYMPDGSLEVWLKKYGDTSPPMELALNMASGILAGLDHLHSRRIVHRDLKPANILLQGDTPRLADFGIARVLKTTSQSSNIAGTPVYMAPEAFDGKRNEQTDIRSVGIIIYQLLTGRMPFPHTDVTSLMGAILSRNPDPLPASVPMPLHRFIESALHKDPSLRFKSVKNMRQALEEAVRQIRIQQEASTVPAINLFNPSDESTIVKQLAPIHNAAQRADELEQAELPYAIPVRQLPNNIPSASVVIPASSSTNRQPRVKEDVEAPTQREEMTSTLQQLSANTAQEAARRVEESSDESRRKNRVTVAAIFILLLVVFVAAIVYLRRSPSITASADQHSDRLAQNSPEESSSSSSLNQNVNGSTTMLTNSASQQNNTGASKSNENETRAQNKNESIAVSDSINKPPATSTTNKNTQTTSVQQPVTSKTQPVQSSPAGVPSTTQTPIRVLVGYGVGEANNSSYPGLSVGILIDGEWVWQPITRNSLRVAFTLPGPGTYSYRMRDSFGQGQGTITVHSRAFYKVKRRGNSLVLEEND